MKKPVRPNLVPIPIDQITRDPRLQVRRRIDPATVARYAELRRAGKELAPPVLYDDGETKWLADGHHTLAAAEENQETEVTCELRKGTFRDALLHSKGANAGHGLNLTNHEKRSSVRSMVEDEEWRDWSDRKIAEHVGVSHTMVSQARRRLHPENPNQATMGRDGRVRRRPTKKSTLTSPSMPKGPKEVPPATSTGSGCQSEESPAVAFVRAVVAITVASPGTEDWQWLDLFTELLSRLDDGMTGEDLVGWVGEWISRSPLDARLNNILCRCDDAPTENSKEQEQAIDALGRAAGAAMKGKDRPSPQLVARLERRALTLLGR